MLVRGRGRRCERRPLIGAAARHLAKPKKTVARSVENAAMCARVLSAIVLRAKMGF